MPALFTEDHDVFNDNWVLAANLVIWTGLFFYLLYLNFQIRDLEKNR